VSWWCTRSRLRTAGAGGEWGRNLAGRPTVLDLIRLRDPLHAGRPIARGAPWRSAHGSACRCWTSARRGRRILAGTVRRGPVALAERLAAGDSARSGDAPHSPAMPGLPAIRRHRRPDRLGTGRSAVCRAWMICSGPSRRGQRPPRQRPDLTSLDRGTGWPGTVKGRHWETYRWESHPLELANATLPFQIEIDFAIFGGDRSAPVGRGRRRSAGFAWRPRTSATWQGQPPAARGCRRRAPSGCNPPRRA